MLRTLGLAVISALRAVGIAVVIIPPLLYRRAKAGRVFVRQLRQYGIPEDGIRELAKQYRYLGGDWGDRGDRGR